MAAGESRPYKKVWGEKMGCENLDIKMVAIDIDGTLLGDDLVISPAAKEAIAAAMAKGVHVTLATGRMYQSALPYAQELGVAVPLITYQGGLVKLSSSGETLYHRELPRHLAEDVIKKARQYNFHINAYYQDRLYMEQDSRRGRKYSQVTGVEIHLVDDLCQFLTDDPTKLLVIGREEELDLMQSKCSELFGEKVYITKSKNHFLEFLHPQATKGNGVEAVAGWLGISPSQVMAIGDSYNDVEMFQRVGWSVVMGNARDEVKQHANYVTACQQDDGVAEAIRKFVLTG